MTLEDFKAARSVLAGVINNTELVYSAALSKATPREVLRQMAKLGADSLPIVSMTSMCTGMVLSLIHL